MDTAPSPVPASQPPNAWLRPFQSLRPWLFALLFLLLLDVALRLSLPPDPRVLRQPLRSHACMADGALDALSDLRALGDISDSAGPPVDVVLLGDSVFASVNNPPGQQLVDALAERLKALGLTARVHNLSAGGSHAADQYGALIRLHRRLSAQPMGLTNLLVVLSTNPIFFSRRHSQPPAIYPCVFEELADDDLGGSNRADALRRRLGLPRPAPVLEQWAASGLVRVWYAYQQRRKMAEALYAGQSSLLEALRVHRARLRGPGSATSPTTRDPNQPWFAQGLTAAQYASSYDVLPNDDPLAYNAQLTVELAAWLAQHRNLPVLVEQVPQNHHLMGPVTRTPTYQALTQQIAAWFAQAGVPFRSHDGAADLTSEQFQDLDHLTARGNATLAAHLATDIVALWRQDLRSATVANPSAILPSAR